MRVKEWGREEEWITWMNKRCWSTGGEIRDCWLTTKAVYSRMQGTESQGKGLILFSSFWELSKTWIAFLVFPSPSPFPLSPFLPIVIRRSRSTSYLSVYHSIQWLPIASYLLLCIFYLVLYGYEKKKKSLFLSCIWLFVTLWTVAGQVPLPMGFPRQEYSSGLPFPSLVSLP